jgi:hypothetical protein
MSEEIKLEFSSPEPLVDPDAKSNPLEWVFHSMGRLRQLVFEVLSPNETAIVQFTSFFVAKVESEAIVIQRKPSNDEIDDDLANANLIMNIGLSAADHPVVIQLDIDPPINAGYSHVYTFESRGSRDHIEVSVPLNQIECALVDGNQIGLLQRHFTRQKSSLNVSQPGVVGEKFVTQSEISEILTRASLAPLNQKVRMVSGERQRTDLDNERIQYALIIKGAGDVHKQETSTYTLEGRIKLGDLAQV